ncbi:transposase, IS605 OrfB family [Stanieria cyanosphaera PCC 7437]|uniref:Transposase, IS605 OrfB family n=1 Tax=Stanieria cyanosphaera (strain ATCC 29371 / PCC 7437) TaxID=111780 RepID=K9XPB1_STAC7|nr:RNA-guided endonuclease TnpB family protein [Stanieria cyanosphaera]AFZ33886.1 transposase, IS605 OrfB family [Stanieria cyanosphaera PCC 7437]
MEDLKPNYQTQKILLSGNVSDETESYLIWACHLSNNLSNSTLFSVRQAHFARCPRREFFDKNDFYRSEFKDRYVSVSYAQLCKDFKFNHNYIGLGGQQAQQCIKSVVESIQSYNQLLKKYWQKEIDIKPKLPNYRKSGGLNQVTFPSQAVTYNKYEGYCSLAISNEARPNLEIKKLIIPSGVDFKPEQLVEVRITPSNGKLWAEYVYKSDKKQANDLDYSQAIGLDPGVNNWLTGVSTLGKSFILCGKKIKSINQKYNKLVAKYKKGKSNFSWDSFLANLTHKRNCQRRDVVNKAARFIINYCLVNKIGNIVFGWGKEIKQNSNLGKINNQNFVAIPTARLKKRIKELAEAIGIKFIETEEAYTSKSDYLAEDCLFKFGEKPEQYRFSVRRITRGNYRSKFGIICADALGAINIIKKVAIQLGISLVEVGRESLIVPKRYDLFSNLKKLYRKRSEMVLRLSRSNA